MGYGFGFQLALVHKPATYRRATDGLNVLLDEETLDEFCAQVVMTYTKMQKEDAKRGLYLLPAIGVKEHGPAGYYSCGGLESQKDFLDSFKTFASHFPGLTFALYHFYSDFRVLSIYISFQRKDIYLFKEKITINYVI